MKYPTKLSDAVHILAFIALHPESNLTSDKIAESIQTNPGYVRQLMSALRKSCLLNSVRGHPRPTLAKEPCQITLLDAYRAVEGNRPLLHQDTHTNPACGVGVKEPAPTQTAPSRGTWASRPGKKAAVRRAAAA